jgi:hypothetical protein
MEQRVHESLARRRFSMSPLGVFASVALALATIGIYGVMAYLVSQGTREIGIRMALGATQNDVLGLIVRQGMTLAISGLATGLTGAFALTRLIRSLLFGVEATDPLTFVGISVLLAFIALLASYIPAPRELTPWSPCGVINLNLWPAGNPADQEFQATRDNCFLRVSHSAPERMRGATSIRRGVSWKTLAAFQGRPSLVRYSRMFKASAMLLKEMS